MTSLRRAVWIAIAIVAGFAAIPSGSAWAASAAPLAWVGLDHNIHYCTGDCAKPICLTCPVKGLEARAAGHLRAVALEKIDNAPQMVAYTWPTISPDGKLIACTWRGHRGAGGEPSFGVSVYSLANDQETILYRSDRDAPIYLYWQPGGERLSFLVAGSNGLVLMVAEASGHSPLRIVASGMPLYYDWNRTATRLVIHSSRRDDQGSGRNEHVVLMALSDSDQKVERVLDRGAAPFMTPAWSPDGKRLAWVVGGDEGSTLDVAGADGSNPRAMAQLSGGIAGFVWTPDSRHLVYAVAADAKDPLYDGLSVLDVQSGARRKLTEDAVLAWFIAPDSRHIAYVAAPSGMPFYTWKVVAIDSGKPRALGNFLVTPEESMAYHYFAQLALSHTIWSPDSSAFVYAGVRVLGAPRHALGVAPAPSVVIVPINGGKQRSLANGTLAFWSAAPAR